ncbi:hypothetical protein [Nocardiopsis lambiniae]|uniref:Molecular chaperone DnaJ n=1 Tax=Nocardiopsis lambiniae TaxID=3075539 RepID=A0ABU2MGC8_9ACTN|nr:hypothetical protein [Nocardiopsis sp. DSM 44743]MDT0331758.1 hypothetical protein [Nocardiopsis sp. DSM 44743]
MDTTPDLIRLSRPLPQPTAEQQDCGMCDGQGGQWITGDGATPGKNHRQWVPCTGCGGTGKK